MAYLRSLAMRYRKDQSISINAQQASQSKCHVGILTQKPTIKHIPVFLAKRCINDQPIRINTQQAFMAITCQNINHQIPRPTNELKPWVKVRTLGPQPSVAMRGQSTRGKHFLNKHQNVPKPNIHNKPPRPSQPIIPLTHRWAQLIQTKS